MGAQVSVQQIESGPAGPAGGSAQTRASDADRDTAASLLNSAFAEGRLTEGEHEERLSAAYAARTWQQLRQLTADLPVPRDAAQPAVAGVAAEPDRCLLCLLLIVCPPAGIAWWLRSRRARLAPAAGSGAQAA
jgi:hypothetical protein